MIAVDANVIVRFLVRDDEKQAEAARKRLKQAERNRERLLVPLLVVLETIRVLESAYSKTRSEILDSIVEEELFPLRRSVFKVVTQIIFLRKAHSTRRFRL